MSDLRRWSEEGANPEEMALLEVSRSDRMSSSSRTRVAGALLGGAAVVTTTAAAAGAGGAGVSLFAKIVGVAVLVGLAAGATWTLLPRPEAPPTSQAPAVAAPAPQSPSATAAESSPPETASAEPAPQPEAEPVAPEAPAPRRAAAAPPPSSSSSALQLTEEVLALERARKALASQTPDAALRELEKYNKRFPRGTLASEEIVLRVQALVARGKHAEAAALADRFSAVHPESPYARRVQDLVRGSRGR